MLEILVIALVVNAALIAFGVMLFKKQNKRTKELIKIINKDEVILNSYYYRNMTSKYFYLCIILLVKEFKRDETKTLISVGDSREIAIAYLNSKGCLIDKESADAIESLTATIRHYLISYAINGNDIVPDFPETTFSFVTSKGITTVGNLHLIEDVRNLCKRLRNDGRAFTFE